MRNNNVKIGGLFNFMELPSDMKRYIRHFGLHFNHKLYEFAISKMNRKIKGSDRTEKMKPIEKSKFDEAMKKYNLTLQYDELYDGVFVWSMAVSDFFESSLPTEKEVAQYVKDYVDDVDQVDGFIFNRWVADMYLKGIGIDWDDFI
jgi:hypothetical protein